VKSEDYKKTAQDIINKKMETHWGKKHILSNKILYDKTPFTFLKDGKKSDFFEGNIYQRISKEFRDYFNASDSLDIKNSLEKEKKKATAIGVRG
jgi:hypothetical protein